MKQVKLTKNYTTIVDDCDYERVLTAGPWRAIVRRRKDGSVWNVYAQRDAINLNGSPTLQKLHRFILNINDPNIKVDHKNHNGLMNNRENLRVSTQSQNSSNRQKIKTHATSSKFKGVAWYKPLQKWRVQIEIGGKKKHLGYFTNELEAANVYNLKAKEIFKEFALLNSIKEPENV